MLLKVALPLIFLATLAHAEDTKPSVDFVPPSAAHRAAAPTVGFDASAKVTTTLTDVAAIIQAARAQAIADAAAVTAKKALDDMQKQATPPAK